MRRSFTRKVTNVAALTLSVGATAVGLFFLGAILWTLLKNGLAGMSVPLFTQMTPPPGSAGGGLLNAIFGSAVMTLIGIAVGAPIGVLAGTYLAEYGGNSKLSSTIRFVNDVLLSAPSIIIGLFVYESVVVPMGHFSAIAGAVALAIIAIPVTVRTTEDMLRLVPQGMKDASTALGAYPWRTTLSVIYPAARSGILTGLLLAIARVSGETAPLLFTALNNQFWSKDLNAPMANLPVVIYQFAQSPYPQWQQLAWSGALLITLTILALSIFAHCGLGPAALEANMSLGATTDNAAAPVGSGAAVSGAPRPVSGPLKVTVRNLHFYYGNSHALKNINLDLPDRSITAFIGPSGCGKSTLLRVLNRMYALYPGHRAEGEVLLDGSNILDPTVDVAELRFRVGMVFQKPTPFPMSIFDNVAFGIRLAQRTSRRDLAERVESALRDAAMWDEVKDKLHEDGRGLSGGQQQRLCIARTIAVRPEVILFDEPTAALDPISTLRVEETLQSLREKYCIAIVTHNLQQAARVSNTTAFMYLGELIEVGPAEQIFTAPKDRRTDDYVTGRFG